MLKKWAIYMKNYPSWPENKFSVPKSFETLDKSKKPLGSAVNNQWKRLIKLKNIFLNNVQTTFAKDSIVHGTSFSPVK